jgi:hypothetical protein
VDVALAGAASRNAGDAEAVLDEAESAARAVLEGLGGRKPDLVLAFSSVARLRTSLLGDPGRELERLRAVFGPDVPVFGCFGGTGMGTDRAGRFSAGESRLMIAAIVGL